MSVLAHHAATLVSVEPSLRERLGGRRAISWQAVVTGDLLIVVLATLLAAISPGGRNPLDAATDVFAITMASALVAALYTGLAHLTIFRHRTHSPRAVPVTIAFHLSIGVIFVAGFFLGAAILGIPALGGSPVFVIAVLVGGLVVCLPTTLALDASDRYRDARRDLVTQLAELERLRISEWSLRQSLRTLSTSIADEAVTSDVASRLDVLDLSEDTRLSTENWWRASLAHHQVNVTPDAASNAMPSNGRRSPDVFAEQVPLLIADEYPLVRWSHELPNALRAYPRSLLLVTVLTAFTTWLFLAFLVPTTAAFPLGVGAAVSVFVVYGIARKADLEKRTPPVVTLAISIFVSATACVVWTLVNEGNPAFSALACAIAVMTGVFISVGLASWATAVDSARHVQLHKLGDAIARRSKESTAVFASLTTVVTRLSEAQPLANSAAIAACATGLQRVQRDIDPVHARRIIDWTESVVSAPGILLPTNLAGRIDAVVQPWRALADITVVCPSVDIQPDAMDAIVAIVDEAVRNACRHGEAQVISVVVSVESPSDIRIEIVDDGVGLTSSADGVGFDLFTSLGAGSFQATPRSPEPGTQIVVNLDPGRLAHVPG